MKTILWLHQGRTIRERIVKSRWPVRCWNRAKRHRGYYILKEAKSWWFIAWGPSYWRTVCRTAISDKQADLYNREGWE